MASIRASNVWESETFDSSSINQRGAWLHSFPTLEVPCTLSTIGPFVRCHSLKPDLKHLMTARGLLMTSPLV